MILPRRPDDMLVEAGRKREVAKKFRLAANAITPGPLRSRAIKEAEKMEAEAGSLDILARATRRSKSR